MNNFMYAFIFAYKYFSFLVLVATENTEKSEKRERMHKRANTDSTQAYTWTEQTKSRRCAGVR